jgi:L-amino acid N-acyltransferase YncA
VDRGAKTLDRLVAKLRSGHCGTVLTDAEVVYGAKLVFGYDLFPAAQYASVHPAYVKLNDIYMMVGRALPYRDRLVELLSDGIERMTKTGEGARLMDRYRPHP